MATVNGLNLNKSTRFEKLNENKILQKTIIEKNSTKEYLNKTLYTEPVSDIISEFETKTHVDNVSLKVEDSEEIYLEKTEKCDVSVNIDEEMNIDVEEHKYESFHYVSDLITKIRSQDVDEFRNCLSRLEPDKSKVLCTSHDNYGLSPITVAAELGYLEFVKIMIEEYKANPNIPNGVGGWMALHFVLLQGHYELIEWMLSELCSSYNKLQINLGNKDGWTALHIACDHGTKDMDEMNKVISSLLTAGSDPNLKTVEGYTPLYLAAQSGQVQAIQILLENGADSSCEDLDGWTILHAACNSNQINSVKVILDFINNSKKFNNIQKEENNDYINFEYNIQSLDLLESNAYKFHNRLNKEYVADYHCDTKILNIDQVSEDGITALYISSQKGNDKITKLLLERGADPNISEKIGGCAPIHVASQEGHLNVIRLLLGFNTYQFDNRETVIKESYLNPKTFKNRINYTDPNLQALGSSWTGLHYAAQEGKTDSIHELILRGANINAKTKFGHTALHIAIQNGKVDTVRVLIDLKTDVNVLDNDGLAAVHHAALNGFKEILNLLIVYYSETVIQNSLNSSFELNKSTFSEELFDDYRNNSCDQQIAESNRRIHRLKYSNSNSLTINSSMVDLETADGLTCLMIAVLNKQKHIVQYLIEIGADVNFVENKRFSEQSSNLDFEIPLISENIKKYSNLNENKLNLDLKTNNENRESIKDLIMNSQSLIDEQIIENNLEYSKILNPNLKQTDFNDSLTNENALSILQIVCDVIDVEIVTLLLKAGAKINYKDRRGYTCIHIIAENGSIELLDLILHCDKSLNNSSNLCAANIGIFHENHSNNNLNVTEKSKITNNYFNSDINNLSNSHFNYKYCDIEQINYTEEFRQPEFGQNNPRPSFDSTSSSLNDDQIVISALSNLNNEEKNSSHNHKQYLKLQSLNSDIDNNANIDNFINDQSFNGHSPLYLAAYYGHISIVEKLITLEVKLNKVDFLGWTVLHKASQAGNSKIVEILVSSGCDVDRKTYHGFTALHLACNNGNLNTVISLLSLGLANPDLAEHQGCSPIHTAAKHGYDSIIESLLEYGAMVNKPDCNGWTALHYAIQNDKIITSQLLLRLKTNVNLRTVNDVSPLLMCMHKTYPMTDVVEKLLQNGSNPDLQDVTGLAPLHLSCDKGWLAVAELLLNYGANSNIETHDLIVPIYLAAKSSHLDIVELLLRNEADPNIAVLDGFTALHVASQNNDISIVHCLLEHNSLPNCCDDLGWTPLFFACQYGNLNVSRMLLKYGANTSLLSTDGVTILFLTIQNGHLSLSEELILWGAEVNNPNGDGMTCLIWAAQQGDLEMVQMLLFNGANPNRQDDKGITPLHRACFNGHKKVTELLIKAGADLNQIDFINGVTPIQLAHQNEHWEIIEWLTENGISANSLETNNYLDTKSWASYLKDFVNKTFTYSHRTTNSKDYKILENHDGISIEKLNYSGELLDRNNKTIFTKFLLNKGVNDNLSIPLRGNPVCSV